MAKKSKKSNNFSAAYGSPTNVSGSLGLTKAKRKKKIPKAQHGHNQQTVRKLCREIEMRVNPLDEGACCCALDSNSAKVIPFRAVRRHTVSSLATGDFVVQIQPFLNDVLRDASTMVSGAVTGWGSYSDMPSYDSTSFVQYRVSQCCIRYFSTSAPTDSSGFVGIARLDDYDAAFDTQSMLYSDITLTRQYQADICTTVKPKGEAKHIFIDYTTAHTGGVTDNWGRTYVFGSGLPTSAVVGHIEIIIIGEQIPHSSNNYAHLTRTAGPHLPQIQSSIDNIQSKVPTSTDGTKGLAGTLGDLVKAEVGGLLATLAPYALEAMMALL
jgi:hypothetical protein